MRSKFSFLDFPGKVRMKDPDDEYLFIREVELDGQGGAVYPRHSGINRRLIPANDARPPLACYFGRVLGGKSLGRNWRGSNRIERYSLKRRSYLGPTSMDAELSLIMTNLAKVREGSFAFDPFVGTGSILLTAALRGAYTFGTDIDLRVLRGRSREENVASNFRQYGLPPPGESLCAHVYGRSFVSVRRRLPPQRSALNTPAKCAILHHDVGLDVRRQSWCGATTRFTLDTIGTTRPCSTPS